MRSPETYILIQLEHLELFVCGDHLLTINGLPCKVYYFYCYYFQVSLNCIFVTWKNFFASIDLVTGSGTLWEQILNVEMECKAVRTAFPLRFLLRNYETALSIVTWVVFGHRATEAGTLGILKCFGQFLPHKKAIFFGPSWHAWK